MSFLCVCLQLVLDQIRLSIKWMLPLLPRWVVVEHVDLYYMFVAILLGLWRDMWIINWATSPLVTLTWALCLLFHFTWWSPRTHDNTFHCLAFSVALILSVAIVLFKCNSTCESKCFYLVMQGLMWRFACWMPAPVCVVEGLVLVAMSWKDFT